MFTGWIDLEEEVLKYHKLINMVVSLRGYGKTSAAKKLAVKRFRENGTKTLWIRRYKKELTQKMLRSFTNNFEEIGIENPQEFTVKNNSLYCGKEEVIRFVVLSQSAYQKSEGFEKFSLMIFDEFLVAKSSIRYMPGEVNMFLEFLNTCVRFREDFTCLLLGNHMTNYNPYYNYFRITVTPGKDMHITRKEFLFTFRHNESFVQMAKQSRFARAVENTPYYDYAYEGSANIASRDIVKTQPSKAQPLCNVEHHFNRYTLYLDANEPAVYINQYAKNNLVTLHTLADEGGKDTIFYRAKSVRNLSQFIRNMCDNNAIYAASVRVAQDASEIIDIFQ